MKLRSNALVVKVSEGRFLALALALLLIGCSYATYPPRIVKGAAFPIDEAKAVQKGDTASDVRAVLGPPLEIEAEGDITVWRYYARERKDGVTYLLGLIPRRTPHFIWDYELKLTVDDNVIETASYTETQVK